MTKPGDVDHYTRVRCYQALLRPLPRSRPPRSRCCRSRCGWAARARRCGTRSSARTTAAPTSSSAATTPARARTRAASRSTARTTRRSCCASTRTSSASRWSPSSRWSTSQDEDQYVPRRRSRRRARRTLDISGTELRRPPARGPRDPRLVLLPRGRRGAAPHAIRRAHAQGFTVFFTGLSGSGKSTIANALMVKLLEMGGRPVTLLDGDLVRKHLSSELGFSQGAPRHQHPPHRLRRVRDHQERRHRDLRPDRALRRDARRRCAR